MRADADARWSPAWFPVVGAAVGAFAGAVRLVLDPSLGAPAATVLAVAALVLVTGALHLDGLADCADALGARGDRARRLAVMREPQVGAFAVLALVLWLLVLVTALSGLARSDALRTLVVAGALGRWGALLHARLAPPARGDGLGAAFAVGRAPFALAAVAAGAVALSLESPGRAAAAIAATVLVSLAVSAWARRSLGGRTGDTLGAAVSLSEAAVCVLLLGLIRS